MVHMRNLCGLWFLNLILSIGLSASQESSDEPRKFSVVPPGYDKLKIPLSQTKNKTSVRVSASIMIAGLDIDAKNGIIGLEADFSMRWLDGHIYDHYQKHGWKDPKTGDRIPNVTKLEADILEKLWTPDIFFDEMLEAKKSNILSKPVMLSFIGPTELHDHGEILYSARIFFKLMCPMSFEYYPADTQTCPFHLRSYSYTANELYLEWRFGSSVGVFLEPYDNPNFNIQVASVEPLHKSRALYIEENFDNYRRGNYSALKFEIKIRRKLSYHLTQTYLPSVLLIGITWLCFFLTTSMVEARSGIAMTTVLTLTAMFAAVREKSPDVSYPMAIDLWMVFCIIYVFLSLHCFFLSYWMKRKLDEKRLNKETPEGEAQDGSEIPSYKIYSIFVNVTTKYAFTLFSVTFLIFVAVYWWLLLLWSNYLDWNVDPRFNGVKGIDPRNLYRHLSVDVPGVAASSTTTNPTFLDLIRNDTPELINLYRTKD